MNKKLLIGISIFYFLPLMLTILQGCIPSCGNEKVSYFEVDKMYVLSNIRVSGENISYNNQLISTSEINFWVRTDVRYYSFMKQKSNGFMAMALDCSNTFESKETIMNIEIFSNKDFQGYPVGDNLASLFKIAEFNDSREKNVVEYLATKPKALETYYLIFEENAKPTSGIHQISIIYTDSRNRVFKLVTDINFK